MDVLDVTDRSTGQRVAAVNGRDLVAAVERHEPRWRGAVLALAGVIVAAQWIRLAVNPLGDLQNHRTFAVRLLSGAGLYEGGLDVPYTPFWALAHVPATYLPARAMPATLFPTGVIALAILLVLLDRLCRDLQPVDRRAAFWVGAGSVALASRFVLRDLLDAGPNLAIVALTWGSVYLWRRDRWGAAGLCLGLAAALKLTAVIFVAYFAWKRQWRMAAWSLAAAMLFSLTPAIWMGWPSFVQHMNIWSSTLADAFRQPDPRVGVLGLESVQNISLGPALARFLMHLPAGADGQGRFVHPLNVDVLTLAPAVAGAIIRLVFVALIGSAMWMTRKPLAAPRDARAIWECAGVAALGLLLSPITWRAHAVAVLPACYLILRHAAAGGRISASARAAIVLLIATSLILSRGVAGETVSGLVHAYGLFTWTFLVLMFSMWRSAARLEHGVCVPTAD